MAVTVRRELNTGHHTDKVDGKSGGGVAQSLAEDRRARSSSLIPVPIAMFVISVANHLNRLQHAPK